jgi:Uncharacterised nucleotidyltransferase
MQTSSPSAESPAATFYLDVFARLEAAGIPFLIGGAFALTRYSSIHRETKDLDVIVRPEDARRVLTVMRQAGYETEVTFPHWLAKIFWNGHFIDIIFSSGNGMTRVDDAWFEHAVVGEVLGHRVRLCPPEEMIWTKAFVQERERFDGADVLHLIRALGHSLDWPRVLARFGDHWPVLLSHVILFRYVYPDRTEQVPAWVVQELTTRLASQKTEPRHVCRGTLLSREQYLWDLERLRYDDARARPDGTMNREEIEIWTKAIGQVDRTE